MMITIRLRSLILFLAAFIISMQAVNSSFARSLYYYENFGLTNAVMATNGWNTNFPMSRDFWNDNTAANRWYITNQTASQRMMLFGDPNGNTAYDQWYTGKGSIFRPLSNAQLGNKDIGASEEEPFGFMIVRYATYVHREVTLPHDLDAYGNWDPNYGKGLLEVWMAEDNDAKQFGDSFDNFVFWYDKAFNRWSSSDGASQTISNNIWGYYNLYERDYSGYYDSTWTNLTDIDGNSIDPNAAFRRQYSYTNTVTHLSGLQNENSSNTNACTNEMAVKMVHDGKKITIYLNLDPEGDNAGALKNSWIKFAEVPVAWTNKLVAYFGAESPSPNAAWQYTYTQYRHFMIRSVNSNLVASIYPTNTTTNLLTSFSLYLTNYTGTTNESGIGEIVVKKPATFVSNWILTNVWVSNSYGVLTNTNTNMNPPAGKFSLTTNASGEMVIRFRAATSADNQIVTNSNSPIVISFLAFTASTPNSSGDTFEVYADNYKHDDTGLDWVFNNGTGIKYATTGRKKAVAAFNNAMLVRSYNSPVGYSGLLPNRVYEGVETVYQYDIAAANPNNNAYITKATIFIPVGFGVDTNLIYSEKMGSSNGVYLYLTNFSGVSNAVIADYASKGLYLPANGGWDTISIKCTNTTNVPDGSSGVTVSWPAQVYSSLTLNSTNTATNSYYPSQQLLVRKKPPVGTVAVTPNEVSNTVLSNGFDIVIRNTATEDPNRIKYAQISLPQVFTNIVSSVSASNGIIVTFTSNSNLWVAVSYTNSNNYIPANNGYDVIHLVLDDQVASLSDMTNVAVTAYGDNLNGDPLKLLTVDGGGSANVLFYTPPANMYAHIDNPGPEGGTGVGHAIYTDMDVETNLAIVLENKGEEANHISMARLVFPVGITNVQYVGDTKLAGWALSNEYTLGVTNIVTNTNFVLYLNYTNTLKSKIGATPAEQDFVYLKIWDAIDSPSNAHIDVSAKNVKTNYAAASETPDTTMLNYIYPPVNAQGYVSTAGGFIDWSTVTNTIDYYITNMGRTKNEILQAQIFVPAEISTNIPVTSITSTLITNYSGTVTFNGGVITVNYAGNGLKFSGGRQDKISFQMIDIVTNTVTVKLTNVVTNNRTNNMLAESSSNSQNLYFQTPPVMATYKVEPSVLFIQSSGVVTDQIVLTITNEGIGNNNINLVKITAPFNSAKVAEIYDSVMGTNMSQAPSLIDMTGSLISLYYTNSSSNLTAGNVDTVTVYLKNNFTNEQDLGWSAVADNDLSDAVALTNVGVMPGYTNRTYLVEKAQVYAEPNTIVTATYSNYIRYSLKNGTVGDSTGQPIYSAKIIVTDPFTNIAGISIEQAGSFTVTNIDATTMWILVQYTGGLQAGEADNIRFWLADNWYVGTNYVNLASEVDYNDGGGWRSTAVESAKSTGIAFTFPPASATGYVLSGEFVPEDFTNYTYKFYLKNTGESGNDIKVVKITPPATITNITSVTSLTKLVGGTFDGTNVWLDYASAGKLLNSSSNDVIQLVGYDNVSAGPVYSAWGMKVANTTTNDDTYRIDVGVPVNKSLSNIIYHPTYKTSTYLEALTPIDGADSNKNRVWTTKTTNIFKYYIFNQSDTGNNITKARILIPGGVTFFVTNSFKNVSSIKGITNYFSNSMTELWVIYSNNTLSSNLVPGDVDTVQFTVNDTFDYGETNLDWLCDAAYDTTDNRLKASLEYTGKSWKSYFVMPAPMASSGIVLNPGSSLTFREIYLKTTNFNMAYMVTNTGDGTSDIFSVMLTIPAPFRGSFGAGSVSNALATNWAYNSGTGVLTLSYSNDFKPKKSDLVYLNLQASGLTVTNYGFDCQVSNSTYSSSAVDPAGITNVLNIVNVPTYYVTPNTLATTTSSNGVDLNIINNSGGDAKLAVVELSFSSPFTNVAQALTSKSNVSITGTISNLVLVYSNNNNGISAGDYDAVSFGLLDNLELGDMPAYVTARGYNGFQWVDMDRDVAGQTNMDFIMPSADATAWIDSGNRQILTTTGVTNMKISVTNKGAGSNRLTKLKIYVPGGLTVLSVSNELYPDAVATNSNNTIYIDYQGTNLFQCGTHDAVLLSFSNTLATGTNINFSLEGVNLTNGPIDSRFVAIPGEPLEGGAGALNMRVDFPPINVQGYINGRSQFFTINTNDKIEYRIVNGSVNTTLTNAKIYYDPNLYSITGVSNTWTNSSWSTNADYLEINYTTGIQFSQRDILTIQMMYNITNITNTMLTSTVILYTNGSPGTFAAIDAGYTQKLDVTVAAWGKIKGWVYPTNFTVAAKVYYPGTSVIATNIDGALASATTVTNGEYSFTFIPNGTYTLELSAAMFRTYTASITVNSNMENLVSVITMQNALMNPASTSNQTAYCYDDSRTKVTFPVSSLARDISININLVDLTQPQKDDLGVNSNVAAPSGTTGMKGFRFDVRNMADSMMEGEVLKLDATLYLAYDLTDITSRGWNEDSLAIYYWDRITAKWVKVGGAVDKVNRYVTAQVSYVHDIYGVFDGKPGDGVIRNVVVRPRIFTPTKSVDGYFGSVRITFELDQLQAPDGYDVKIFDMRGKLVKSFSRKGTYAQGEVAWDSRDDEGYPVKGGVYIYRVLAGGKSYNGTVIIVR